MKKMRDNKKALKKAVKKGVKKGVKKTTKTSKPVKKKPISKTKAFRGEKKASGLLITKENLGKEDSVIKCLEELFSPCRIIKKHEADTISDFTIEIINPLTNRDKRLITGKIFSVWVVSTKKDHLIIDTNFIGEVQKALMPTMFVLKGDGSKINYLWIDEAFFIWLRGNNSNWVSQENIQIPTNLFIPLEKKSVPVIESYLMTLYPSHGKVLQKGIFFEIRTQLKDELKKFIQYVGDKNIDVSNLQFNSLFTRTENSIYTIAIVGPSRTGKSTLINSLVKHKISPVNILPTTGIPFTIQYGKGNNAEVIFTDGTVKEIKATVTELEKYIDQKYNPRNSKNVKFVTVSIDSDKLEKGLAFCDVPGLDDVNDEIRRISKIAVYSSNAIIYLIDTSPYKFGGFSFNSHHLEDLRELAPRMDRLYLVFNKVDVLDEKEIANLKSYINRVLKENDLLKLLPNEPVFVSAKQSFDDLTKKQKGKYDIEVLETNLWDNLLKTNKNGLYNLGALTYEFKEELFKLRNILNTKLMDSDKSEKFKSGIDKVRTQLNTLSKVGEDSRDELLEWLKLYIQSSVNERIDNLGYELRQIPLNAALPNSLAIKQYLETNAFSILNQVFDEVIFKLDNLYGELNYWISKELSQIEIIKDDQYDFLRDKSRIHEIIKPISDNFNVKNVNKTVDLLSGLFGAIEDAVVGIFSFLERLFVGKEKMRERQIEQILSKARGTYFTVFSDVSSQFSNIVRRQYNLMIRQLQDRAGLYVSEVNKQLKNIVPAPDSKARKNIEECINEIEDYAQRVERIKNELIQYTSNNQNAKK